MNTPIHNLQIEQAVLAALMTVSNSYSQVENLLTEDDFHATRHKLIFQAWLIWIRRIHHMTLYCKSVARNAWLSEAAGGEQYIMRLLSDAPKLL
jgi:replicative DNA helicase